MHMYGKSVSYISIVVRFSQDLMSAHRIICSNRMLTNYVRAHSTFPCGACYFVAAVHHSLRSKFSGSAVVNWEEWREGGRECGGIGREGGRGCRGIGREGGREGVLLCFLAFWAILQQL